MFSFRAAVEMSNITIWSDPKYTFVDCEPPRIQVRKPADGQLIRPYAPLTIELKVEDDMLSDWKHFPPTIPPSIATSKYTLKVEIDGSPFTTENMDASFIRVYGGMTLASGLGPGQHAIRLSITDPTGKSDEKTIFVKADGTPPSVSVSGNNDRYAFYSGSVPSLTIYATATDESGIEKVEFYVDGKGVGVEKTPYSGNTYRKIVGISEEGQKTITVRAFDKMGNSSERSATVFVSFEGKPKTIGPVPSPSKTLPVPQKTLPR